MRQPWMLLTFAILLLSSSASWAQPTPLAGTSHSDQIRVTGSAQLAVTPDTMVLQFAIVEDGSSVSKLKLLVDQRTDLIIKALTQAKIATNDINSSQLRIEPRYRYDNNRSVHEGFTVTRQFQVIVRELDRSDTLIDSLIQRGVTHMSPPQLQASQAPEVYQQALLAAYKVAQQKAQGLASSMGRKLGAVIAASEQSAGMAPQYALMDMERSRMGPVSLPGQQAIQADIEVIFALQ